MFCNLTISKCKMLIIQNSHDFNKVDKSLKMDHSSIGCPYWTGSLW